MSYKITGLCGFADYDDVLGAAPRLPSAKPGKIKGKGRGPAPKPAPKPYPKAKQSSTVSEHAKVLTHARKILAHAHGKVKAAAKTTLAKPVAPRSRAVVPRTQIAVHGDDYIVIGAAKIPPAQQPKVKAAAAKLAAAKERQKKAAAVSAAKTKQAHVTVSKLAQQVKAHEAVARKLSGKGGGKIATVHGYVIGADPDPNNPGYLTDGSPDPAYCTGSYDTGYDTAIDPATGASVDPKLDVDTLVAAANAAGAVPPDQYIADSTLVPAIVYDGSKGTPDGYVLSYGLATRASDVGCEPDTAQIEGNAHFGYVWGRYDKKDPNNGGIGWGSHLQQNSWNHVHGRFWLGDDSWWNPCDASEALQSHSKAVDLGAPGTHASGYQTSGEYSHAFAGQTYGPLVGNPVLKDFKGMRVDGNGVMFWIANEAPDWLTYPLKAAAALTKAAADKAAKDAAAADAAAAAKAAADAAAAKAAQDAQNALDEANAASQANQAAYQSDAAMSQTDAQSYQQDLADRQASSQIDTQMYQQDMAERAFALQQAQAQAQYAQQHQLPPPDYAPPDQAVAPTYDDGGSPADDDTAFTPESDSDEEAAEIDAGTATSMEESDVLGAADALARVLGEPTIAGDDAIIGGDGEVVGLDQWGNES